jgi:hypothetical protein
VAHLSHSQLKLWESDPLTWVKWYHFKDPKRELKTYERGKAFDEYVKGMLTGVPSGNDDSGFFSVYESSGVYSWLAGRKYKLDIEIGAIDGIPFKGFLDVFLDGMALDWKTRGEGPTKWYRNLYDRSGVDLGPHKAGCACINQYYGDQLAIYDYAMERSGIGIIHEVGSWGVAVHKGVLDYGVIDRIKYMAEMVFEKKWFLHTVSFEESRRIVDSLGDDIFRGLL